MSKRKLTPIPPGEILYEDFMKPMGVSINALAREIAVPPNRIIRV
jgi:addiction module HigA family antidote